MSQQLLLSEPVALTAEAIVKRLAEKHPHPAWSFFPELRVGCGYGQESDQRIDAWTIHSYPSKLQIRIAYEVKISRSDFLSEKRKPLKRRKALLLSNEFYFVTPPKLIKIEELPPEAGLVEVDEENIKYVVKAPYRDTPPPSWNFLASIARQACQYREWHGRSQELLNECRGQNNDRL